MIKNQLNVLVVEDSEDDALLTLHELKHAGFEVRHRRVETPEDMEAALGEQPWDAIICDFKMPRFSAPAALRLLHERDLDLPFLIVSGTVGEDVAVEAMKLGAHDYFMKNNLKRLGVAIKRELREAQVRRDRRRATETLRTSMRFLEFFNRHNDMPSLLEECVAETKRLSGCQAAGLRLLNPDGHIPYEAHDGFTREFYEQESPLSIHSDRCMCIDVIRGETDPELPWFTEAGSFYINGTSRFLAGLTEEERSRTRNACSRFGFESVALVPIVLGERILGLIHVADPEEGRVSLEKVEMIEAAAMQLGTAVERVRAQQDLREREELYRTLVETSPDSITLTDLRGIILKVNRGTLRLHGYDSEGELVGRNSIELIAERDRERAVEVMKKTLQTGASGSVEYALLRKDGSEFHADLSATLIRDPQGDPREFMAIVRDITERKHMQASLAQADRMASVGTLAAGVAHEINNPLAYVMYNLQSLAEDLPRVTGALSQAWSMLVGQLGVDRAADALGGAREICQQSQLDDLVSRAEEAAEGAARIRDIVRDLRTFSKVEEDQRAPVHLYQVIETALNMVYNEIKYRARVVKDYGSTPPVLASEGRLSQVVLNLLVNAAHAIDEGDVEHNEIRIRTWTEGDEVCVEVKDTGRGIPGENLERLFDPFFTTKPIGVGSGLGLSICHNIVSSFGGKIGVESRVGEGSRFTVRLPRLREEDLPEAKRPEKEEPEPPFVRGRILVVDDEPMIGSTIKRILRREHEVVLASSGAEGREVISRDKKFDLILCDLMMPDVSGMDLHEWVCREYKDLARRMVFITGGAFTPRAREFIDSVPNIHVEKPFDPGNLRKLIRDLLSPNGKRNSDCE